MLTFDPNGGYGHPDHIKIHQAAPMAYFVSAIRALPGANHEGGFAALDGIQVVSGAFPRSRFERYAQMAKKVGLT